jgi:hypothetical protein
VEERGSEGRGGAGKIGRDEIRLGWEFGKVERMGLGWVGGMEKGLELELELDLDLDLDLDIGYTFSFTATTTTTTTTLYLEGTGVGVCGVIWEKGKERSLVLLIRFIHVFFFFFLWRGKE